MSAPQDRAGFWSRLGLDWIAVLVAGVFALAAATGLLPQIPW